MKLWRRTLASIVANNWWKRNKDLLWSKQNSNNNINEAMFTNYIHLFVFWSSIEKERNKNSTEYVFPLGIRHHIAVNIDNGVIFSFILYLFFFSFFYICICTVRKLMNFYSIFRSFVVQCIHLYTFYLLLTHFASIFRFIYCYIVV